MALASISLVSLLLLLLIQWLAVNGASNSSDPQFVGLLGQSYQVHGMDGEVYNLISDKLVQLNARFSFVSSGGCDTEKVTNAPLYACWTQPGSYLTAIGLRTVAGDTIVVNTGEVSQGFDSLLVNGERVQTAAADATKWPITLSSSDPTLPSLTIHRVDQRTLTIANAGLNTLTLQNSGSFINIIHLEVSSMGRLTTTIQPNGIIGQTWQKRADGFEIDGQLSDYVETRGELLGCAFAFNKFDCTCGHSD